MGTATAKMDKLASVRILPYFPRISKEQFGHEVFVTSMDDRSIQIYPLTAWFEFVDNLHNGERDDPLMQRFLMKASYNGQRAKVDGYGRTKIPRFLGKKINLEGEMELGEREDRLVLSPKAKRGE